MWISSKDFLLYSRNWNSIRFDVECAKFDGKEYNFIDGRERGFRSYYLIRVVIVGATGHKIFRDYHDCYASKESAKEAAKLIISEFIGESK